MMLSWYFRVFKLPLSQAAIKLGTSTYLFSCAISDLVCLLCGLMFRRVLLSTGCYVVPKNCIFRSLGPSGQNFPALRGFAPRGAGEADPPPVGLRPLLGGSHPPTSTSSVRDLSAACALVHAASPTLNPK